MPRAADVPDARRGRPARGRRRRLGSLSHQVVDSAPMGLLNRHRLWQVAVDAVLVAVAWYATYVVGFQINRNPGWDAYWKQTILIVVAIKIVCLARLRRLQQVVALPLAARSERARRARSRSASIALLVAFSIVKFPRGVTIHPKASAGQAKQLAAPGCKPVVPHCVTDIKKAAIAESLLPRAGAPAVALQARPPARPRLHADPARRRARRGALADRAAAARIVRRAGQEGADRRRRRRRQPDPARDALEPARRLHADRADRRRPQQAALPLPGRQGARHDRASCPRSSRRASPTRCTSRCPRPAVASAPPSSRPAARPACRSRRCRTSTTSSTATTTSSPSCARCRSRTSSAARPSRSIPAAVGAYVRGRVVLVTGAGGSIGSELCRQLVRMEVGRLVMADHAENNLFQIDRELRETTQIELVPEIADVRDPARMETVFELHQPGRRLPRGRLQARAADGAAPGAGAAQQRARDAHGRAPRGPPRRRPLRARLDRQGRLPEDRDGRQQGARGVGRRGARAGRGRDDVRGRALRQRARIVGLGRADLPRADRARRPGDRHEPAR